ncbi:unnamed protein product [Caenorhabditis angaria]|uniref:Uncharacterized protein n=1 Tax=Caenorhabditis angaria TaxID=860376 RepID=A0A9P1IJ53_9PELO|nr:unnamed protein product [Caenorhabditis angaria]
MGKKRGDADVKCKKKREGKVRLFVRLIVLSTETEKGSKEKEGPEEEGQEKAPLPSGRCFRPEEKKNKGGPGTGLPARLSICAGNRLGIG